MGRIAVEHYKKMDLYLRCQNKKWPIFLLARALLSKKHVKSQSR